MIDKSFENNNFGEDGDDFRRSLGAAMAGNNNGGNNNRDPYYGYEMLANIIMCPKPFGMIWTRSQMIDFLKQRDYRIISKFNENKREEYVIAVKSDSEFIPETDGESNLGDTFTREIQTIILNWLLKIAKDAGTE